MLALYRRLLGLRRESPALSLGRFTLLEGRDDVLAYERSYGSSRLLVVLNLGQQPRSVTLPPGTRVGRVVESTLALRPFDGTLRPDEGLILELSEAER